LTDSHLGGQAGEPKITESEHKSSNLRVIVIALAMVAVAVLAWVPSLFSRGAGQGITHTGTDIDVIFVPVWVALTIGVVIGSFYFSKKLLETEKPRDADPEYSPTSAEQ